MLYEDIRLGCKMYHQYGFAYDKAYVNYIADKNQTKWDNPDRLDYNDVRRLVHFVNQWKCMMPANYNNITHLINNMRSAVPLLNILQSKTLLDVNFDEITADGNAVSQLISECFDGIAQTQRYESVATSKMLNATINPNLFVMWDCRIRSGYHMRTKTGPEYARVFLPKMQEFANQAVSEVMVKENLSRVDAIQSFTERCENKSSLAKIIDEYNYAKFTAKML